MLWAFFRGKLVVKYVVTIYLLLKERGASMIEVKLFAGLRVGREKAYEFPGDKFKNGVEIIEHLEIPKEKVAIFLINGLQSEAEDNVKDGDVISIFPAVGGG